MKFLPHIMKRMLELVLEVIGLGLFIFRVRAGHDDAHFRLLQSIAIVSAQSKRIEDRIKEHLKLLLSIKKLSCLLRG